jgi:NADPH:quinone reductase
MKAIRVHEFGRPEVLNFEELATPKPAAGEVLVRIHAAGVNPYDT